MGQDRRFYPLVLQPGIQKDGSENDSRSCIDGNWIRWRNGFAETMGGITSADNLYFKNEEGEPKSKKGNYLTYMKAFSWNGENYLFVSYTTFRKNENLQENNEVGFYIFEYELNGDPNLSFTPRQVMHYYKKATNDYEFLYDCYFIFEGPFTLYQDEDLNPNAKKYDDGDYFYAQLLYDSSDILNNRKSELYCLKFAPTSISGKSLDGESNIFSNQFIQDFPRYNFNGGVVFQENLFIAFGNGDYIRSSYPDFRKYISTGENEREQITFVDTLSGSNQKTMQGRFVRGGGNAPTLLFWSLTSLSKVINTSDNNDEISFRTDIISDDCSIMSRDCVVEYGGFFYWMGIDSFYTYNGMIAEIPNPFNKRDLFDNIDMTQRQNVVGVANHKYGEIWWFYPDQRYSPHYLNKDDPGYKPFDGNTAAVIYNLADKCWYSVKNINRDCASYSSEDGLFFCGGCDDYLQNNVSEENYNFHKNYAQIFIHDAPLMKKKTLVFNADSLGSEQARMEWHPITATLETPFFSWKFLSPSEQFIGANRQINLVSIEPDVNFLKKLGQDRFWSDKSEDPKNHYEIGVVVQTKKFLMREKKASSELRYIKKNTTQLTYSHTSSGYISLVLTTNCAYRISTFLLQFDIVGEK